MENSYQGNLDGVSECEKYFRIAAQLWTLPWVEGHGALEAEEGWLGASSLYS